MDNKNYYNRVHFFGTEDIKEFEDLLDELDELDDDDNDDLTLDHD